MSNIHASAVIASGATLGENISVGPFTVIGPGVSIGDDTKIGPHVYIEDTAIGKGCRISHGASIGGIPQILNFNADIRSSVKIGDNTVIREYVTIHRSGFENGATEIGNNCLLMDYVHVAHDCKIGNHVIIVNSTGLPGHVEVEERAFISGMVGIHQFVRIGKYAMVGGMAGVRQDVLPFSLVEGNPARLVTTNSVGLRRNNFTSEARAALKSAFKFLLDSELNTSQAIAKIEGEIELFDEIRYLIDFMGKSKRGITK